MRLSIEACPHAASRHLSETIGVSRVVADILVRRGLADPDAARAFLDITGDQHDPMLLGDMEAASRLVEDAIRAGSSIVVHGDYDVDGVCATAVLCSVIRRLGGQAEPLLPSRFEDGYGLSVATIERLAESGCGLLITVDCGITAVEAATRASSLGLALVITDHHTPPETLPDCPLVAPRGRSEYPAALCGTGVAYKLCQALVTRAGAPTALVEAQLDLVAIATIADLVPLTGENRGLVRAGLEALRRTTRPGLRVVLQTARIDRVRLNASDVAFRIAPRLNAAGRMGNAADAYELVTTSDEERARELAGVVEQRNRDRQATEAWILKDAVDAYERLDERRRSARGIVLASSSWHVGVIGIVASRLVERLGRPVVLIALDDQQGRGSGRSIPTFDLHAALASTSQHLASFGGHRAAAGLTITPDRVEAFAEAFAAHADQVLSDDDLVPRERIDAVVSLADVSLELADELERLAPHGIGNPTPRLLLPAVELDGVVTVGTDARHLRFAARSAAGSCRGVLWNGGSQRQRFGQGGRFDINCRVERNDWQGSSAVQLIARSIEPVALPAVEDASTVMRTSHPPAALRQPTPVSGSSACRHDHRGRGAMAELVRLAASGDGVGVVCRDASRRAVLLHGPLDPQRFLVAGACVVDQHTPPAERDTRLAEAQTAPWLVLVDYATLPHCSHAFTQVAVLDPPLSGDDEAALETLAAGVDIHLVYGPAEQRASLRALAAQAPRALVEAVWRALASGPRSVADLAEHILCTTPTDVEWALTVLESAGLVAQVDKRAERVSAPRRTSLADIPAYQERALAYEAATGRLTGVLAEA